ncbi:hypothetical protein [Mycolicibacterium goodii]|uniref:Uncharacterized protein n=1 Tax=Mycolicibacterium goodii TaxID=134601 RepID=A0ABS6HQG2_MYCGD|nr:hypothetical protein [Mycolicibacterium goodii]YP_009013620.1 hypothetical protein DORI_70 [Mycobacterium phage Dori]AER47719.1 hypothetical protein DORI_70 [Mycobacterium phage Dori]MBU8824155.1 hypothetical protein [Mycolicibacterium goodii]MBU8838061.1 hypothetical protein [Mycolicibacterium goodii]
MNATEDGLEPVGEIPEVPARYDAGIASALAAIDRGAVLGIIAGADQVLATKQLAERQTQAINDVRELCGDLISRGQGHGAAPTRAEMIAAEVAESVLAIIEAGA